MGGMLVLLQSEYGLSKYIPSEPAAKTKKDGDGEYQFSLLLTDYCGGGGGGAALARARLHT